jgi:hypothetical protein
MARVDELSNLEMQRTSVHSPVEATYTVFVGDDGSTYLQIDTYGTKDRAIPGKKSQTLQFGPDGLDRLREILATIS